MCVYSSTGRRRRSSWAEYWFRDDARRRFDRGGGTGKIKRKRLLCTGRRRRWCERYQHQLLHSVLDATATNHRISILFLTCACAHTRYRSVCWCNSAITLCLCIVFRLCFLLAFASLHVFIYFIFLYSAHFRIFLCSGFFFCSCCLCARCIFYVSNRTSGVSVECLELSS